MTLNRSNVLKNRLKAFLADLGVSIEQFCQGIGITVELGQMIQDDERLIPPPALLLAVLRAFPGVQKNLVLIDPEADSAYGKPMQVTVCGCGNLGHVFAGLLSARPELTVNVLVSSAERAHLLARRVEANNGIQVRRREGDVLGRPDLITHDPALAVPGSRLILLCVPSHVEDALLQKIIPFLDSDVFIGSVPAAGGFNWKAEHWLKHFKADATVFGLATIPWMCKIVKPGEEVNILGTKDFDAQVTIPAARTQEVSDLLAGLLQMPVLNLDSFLNISLYPANQLLHSAISYDLFHDWDGTPLAEPPLFYEHIGESAAELLQAMDNELQQLCRALEQKIPGLDLRTVLPLGFSIRSAYADDIADASTLRSCIATNRAYAGIRAPMVAVDGGYAPDFQCRFYLEDVPHGLVVIKGVAELADVATPAIDRVLSWCQTKMGCEYLVDGKLQGKDVRDSGAPQRYGMNSLESLLKAG